MKKKEILKKALKDSENQLDKDCKEFIDFVESTKMKLKKEDDEFIKNRRDHEKAESIYRKELNENKKLSEDMEFSYIKY